MNLWKRRKGWPGSVGWKTESVRTQCLCSLLFLWGETIHANWKAGALRSETLGAENMAWLWLSLALVLVVLSSSKTHGGPWRNLTIIVRRVEEHLHIPRGPVLIRDKYQQEPVGAAFAFLLCEDRSFIGHLLLWAPIVSEILGSLNTGRLKTNWNVRRRNPCRGDTQVRDKGSQSRWEWRRQF